MAVQVTAIKHEGKRPWEISVSGGSMLKTFDADVASGLAVGMWIEPVTEVSKNKFHDTMLNEWKPAAPLDNPPPVIAPVPPTVPPEVWEGKDRAMAMMSAWKTAGDLFAGEMSGTGAVYEAVATEARRMAHMIYTDIERARMGGFKVTLEPKHD